MSDAAIIALAGIITTILVNLFQERRVNQKFEHQRQLTQDQEARQLQAAASLATQTQRAADELRRETRKQAEEVKTKVDESTDMSRRAIHEANDVNQKIYNLTKQFLGNDPVEAITTLETIDKTTKDTHEKVEEIREAIDGDGTERH